MARLFWISHFAPLSMTWRKYSINWNGNLSSRVSRPVKGDVRAEIALQLPRTKLCCVLLGETPLHQSRIVDRRNARSARTSPPIKGLYEKERFLSKIPIDNNGSEASWTFSSWFDNHIRGYIVVTPCSRYSSRVIFSLDNFGDQMILIDYIVL